MTKSKVSVCNCSGKTQEIPWKYLHWITFLVKLHLGTLEKYYSCGYVFIARHYSVAVNAYLTNIFSNLS